MTKLTVSTYDLIVNIDGVDIRFEVSQRDGTVYNTAYVWDKAYVEKHDIDDTFGDCEIEFDKWSYDGSDVSEIDSFEVEIDNQSLAKAVTLWRETYA